MKCQFVIRTFYIHHAGMLPRKKTCIVSREMTRKITVRQQAQNKEKENWKQNRSTWARCEPKLQRNNPRWPATYRARQMQSTKNACEFLKRNNTLFHANQSKQRSLYVCLLTFVANFACPEWRAVAVEIIRHWSANATNQTRVWIASVYVCNKVKI